MENLETEGENTKDTKEKTRNIVCFFFLGVLSLIYDEISLAAAEDVLAGSKIATTLVIVAIACPVLGVKITAPWFIQNCSYLFKACIVVVLLLAGLAVIVSVGHVHLRLLGISVIESGVSFGEITFLALTAFYRDTTVSAFVAGIGVASLVGPLYYTALTTWLCLPPRTAMLTTIPWPFLVLVIYAVLEKKDTTTHAHQEKEQAGVKYSALASADPDSEPGGASKKESPPKKESCLDGLSLKEKLSVAKEILPYITYLFLTYLAEYLSNQGIITTLAFSNSPFSPRDHYQYYILCYHVGKFLGRSHIFFMSCTCPKAVPYVRIKKTWILALVEIAHLAFFLFSSWFRFVPHVSIILILCATEGFTAGSMYVNSAFTVSELVCDPKRREFALGLLTIGNGLGKLAAGLLGLHVEPRLINHCINNLNLRDECITRYRHESGWTTNVHCRQQSMLPSSNTTVLN